MAKALECPACGAKHRLDGLESASTFRCERCGQTLKVPAVVPAAATNSGSAVAPPPRRRTPGAPPSREVIAVSTPLPAGTNDGQPGSSTSKPSPTVFGPRRPVHWYWRLAAWVVAVPLGFVITAWPAYEFNLIRKSDVLDIFVGTGTERYTRLAIGTLIWALVTALLVQLLVEGGRWWASRRRRRHDAEVLSGAGASSSDRAESRRARSRRARRRARQPSARKQRAG
jgi:hypothetical protein